MCGKIGESGNLPENNDLNVTYLMLSKHFGEVSKHAFTVTVNKKAQSYQNILMR